MRKIEWWDYDRKTQKKTIEYWTIEYWTVEEVEPGVFQSVFPKWLSHHSQLHTSLEDAWYYIAKCMLEDFCTL